GGNTDGIVHPLDIHRRPPGNADGLADVLGQDHPSNLIHCYNCLHLDQHVNLGLSVSDVTTALGVNAAQIYLAKHRISRLLENSTSTRLLSSLAVVRS